jgi:hypothetical protein
MPSAIDILNLIPEVAAIGQPQLQEYCSQWLDRPLARQYGIAQLAVDDRLGLTVNLDAQRAEFVGDRALIPIDELIGYIIDSHFQDRAERDRLHLTARAIRNGINETGHQYEATLGRTGTLYLICKSCGAVLETEHKGIEGQVVECPPCNVTCPACGRSNVYDGSDLKLNLDVA